ncbi:MAG TPA: cytochrome P460 family protein [Candidatus Acidoferrales bacterium]|nr:cytochrome P460 family protein [Candidatus Acidoferrales bacterium]
MKRIIYLLVGVATLAAVVALKTPASGQVEGDAAPIYGVKLPSGYRNWPLISVARVGAPVNDIRAKLGNDIAIKAFREGTIPYPDGTIIARLAWKQVVSEENNNAIRIVAEKRLPPDQVQKLLDESFVAGPAINVQLMVKDSKKYASTGGWGFAQFDDGKPADEATLKTCFGCHSPAKDRDFVFTRYTP